MKEKWVKFKYCKDYDVDVSIISNIFTSVGVMWYNDYKPTQYDIRLNRERIKDRMPKKPKWRKNDN